MEKFTETITLLKDRFRAADGTVFCTKEECVEYENSALGVLSCRLKRLNKEDAFQSAICPGYGEENEVEIFDIKTEEELNWLKQYLTIKTKDSKICDYTKNLTSGHEIIVFWDYDNTWCWVFGDGSFESYVNMIMNGYKTLLKEN